MKRSKWKGVYAVGPKKQENLLNLTREISRSSSIVPKFIGQTFRVHTGKDCKEVAVTKQMLGHKFGEFSKTRVEFNFKKKTKKKK